MVVVIVPSAHAITDIVTPCGARSSVVLVTLMTSSPTFSSGNFLVGNDAGEPRIDFVSLPDFVVKVTMISNTLGEETTILRTMAPPAGISMINDGFSSVKSTPFLIRSFLFGISVGDVFTESVAMSVIIYSISSQYFGVAVDALVDDIVLSVAPDDPSVVLVPLVTGTGVLALVPCVDAGDPKVLPMVPVL